ncbi:hypothetical protein [Desulfovibrio sp.]|uniref:hypothetical protein n=1 Tax=Desulfovibrio sp. TaxID=885 RepID=UPI0035B3A790
MAFYTKRANEKPPVGKRRGLVRNLTAAEQSGSQEEAGNINKFVSVCSTALVCRTPLLAKSCGRLNPFSTGASGSQDSGAFFIWRNSLKTQAKKIARDMFAAVWQAASMNCGQHRMEEILGQGAAQFFTYFSANIFFNFF